MLEKPPRGLFVIGTDTSVGKTFVACGLARAARARGIRVAAYKPAESGWLDPLDPESDAVRLWEACGRLGEIAEVCPQRFQTPLAPHLAARAEGRSFDESLLATGLQVWAERADAVLVEGAGGLLSPLGERTDVADLANHLGYPLLLVADDRVGVINQVRLTLLAASVRCPSLTVAGVVLNRSRNIEDPSRDSNAVELRQRIEPKIVAIVEQGSEAIDWDSDFWSRW